MSKRYYLAFLYPYMQSSGTTTESWNGQERIAGTMCSFPSEDVRREWLAEEQLDIPYHLGGGERVALTKKEARDLCRHLTIKQFNKLLEDVQTDTGY